MGGGQISLTSVLVLAFVHVLLCLFAFPALLTVPAPSVPSSNAQQVRSSDALVLWKDHTNAAKAVCSIAKSATEPMGPFS